MLPKDVPLRVLGKGGYPMKYNQHLTLGIWRAMWNASHFIDLYLSELKGNGVQSYRKVYPNSTYMSAKASVGRLLEKSSVQQMLKQKLEGVEKCFLC